MTGQRTVWDRYHVIIGLVVMILGAASRIGTNSWLLTILGIVIGIAIAVLPRTSRTD